MKKITVIIFTGLIFFLGLPYSFSQCKPRPIVKEYKAQLKPYDYDGYATSDIEINEKVNKVEVEFTAFAGQKYRIVFCPTGFEEKIKLNIYDKSSRNKKRNKVYDNEKNINNSFWIFEPAKNGTFYIEYETPPSAKGVATKQGCIIMLIGYQ